MHFFIRIAEILLGVIFLGAGYLLAIEKGVEIIAGSFLLP